MFNTKVLVISHNAFSLTNNMGKTLNSLFGTFSKENIAQLYFHILNSDVDVCKTLFRITDRDVLHSIINRSKCGDIISGDKNSTRSTTHIDSRVYQYGQKRTAIKHLLRDLLWKLGKWESKYLIKWLEDYKPDVIFFASGYSMFSINIAMSIANKLNIPLVTYFCDDYFDFTFSSHKFSLVSTIRIKLFRKKIRVLVNNSRELVFISESMKNKYNDLFHKKGHVIMTPYSNYQLDYKPVSSPLIISYVGSVGGNRWMTLLKIGEALENINFDGVKILLHIYSIVNNKEIITKLSVGKSVIFKGSADSDMIKAIYNDTDILLHVESFKQEDINRVRYSVSTKIADCLASNRAFLAVGPKGIASIDYLKENSVAYVIDNENMIEDKLNEYFIDSNIDEKIIRRAKELAEKNHDMKVNSERLKAIFENIVKG